MNRIGFSKPLLLLFFICVSWANNTVKGQESVTLSQCYEWARINYPQIRQYDLIDRSEQYNLANAGKGWLPQLSVSGKISYQSEVTKLPFDTEILSSLLPGFDIPTLSKDQYQIVGEVNQTIWDGGLIHSARAFTKAEATANREQLESNLYALNDRVNQLYFGCLLQDELIRQNHILQKELQVNIDRVKSMMDNGVANQSDRESMEVELLNARQQAIMLKASRMAYQQMLGGLIGKRLADDVILITPPLAGNTFSGGINRPELRAMDANIAFMEIRNKQITADLMPRFAAFVQGGYGRPGLNMLEDSFAPFYIAGVRMSWNLGKLYTVKNDRRKVEVSRRNIELQRETFLFNLQLQLLQQNTEIQKIRDLMRSDEEIILLRGSIKKAAEVKLENGVISVTDLIREIHAEDMAKQQGAAHKIQHLMAVYNYLYSTNDKIE